MLGGEIMELSYNERSIVEQALIEYGFWIDVNEDSKDRKIEVNNTIVKVLNKLCILDRL